MVRCCAQRPESENGSGISLPLWSVATAMQNIIRPRTDEKAVQKEPKTKRAAWAAPTERLREMLVEVDFDFAKMRKTLRSSTDRAETAERAAAAARYALQRARQSRNAEIDRAMLAIPETSKLLLASLHAAQIRAARAERDAADAFEELAEALDELRKTKDQSTQYIMLAALSSISFCAFVSSL